MTDPEAVLTDGELERLADMVAVRIAGIRPAGRQLLTVDDVSMSFRVSRAWVYENAVRLGGVKLGPGERAPLRFHPDTVAGALRPVGATDPSSPRPAPEAPARRRKPARLLPVYDG